MPKLYPGIRLLILCIAIGAPSLVFAQPAITSVSPLSGLLASTVTITGSNFSSTPANNIVWFGSVPAPVTSASSTSLTVTVPPGASYQPITITSNNLTSYPFKPFITTFSDTGQFKPSAFSSITTIPTGDGPQSIFSMDLDGDGKPDLLIADGDSNIITVYHNNSTPGSISFTPQGSYIMGSNDYPIGITAGDLDGDGKPEIVVSNFYSQNISIFRNTSTSGHITLAAPITLAAGNYATGATIADLNGDGKPEIIVACGGSDYLSTYTNHSSVGSLSFSAKVNWTVPSGSAPFKVEVADIDGDGLPDMVAANGNTNVVSVFRNISSGTVSFATHVDFATGNAPQGLAIGDLDGDGKPDLAVANNNDNTLSLLRNTSSSGTISFATQQVVNSGSGAYDLVISDLDGDGKPDLAVDDESGSSVSIHKNISTVGTIAVNPNVDYATGNIPFAITTADYDGDGRPDLATANNTDATITILRNKGANEPGINSFSPTIGEAGTVVTITGNNLSGVTGVSFGGTPATSFTLVSSTTITASVGSGATGAVAVDIPNDTLTLPGYTYGIPPSISSISPDSGATGATILITGTGFTGTSVVTFGGTPANSFAVLSDTQISAIVGVGATGSVAITTPTDTASIGGFSYIYTPLPPVQLTAFSPDSAGPGATIAITGQNLSGITSITFGGTPAYLNIISDSLVYAIVGQGTSGTLVVNGNNGEDSLTGFIYIPPPPPPPGIEVTGFNPTNGTTGTTITIMGHYLTGATSVSFGATQATSFNVLSDSVIQAVVGAGSTGGVTVVSATSSESLSGFVYLYDTTRTVQQTPPPPAVFKLQSFSGAFSGNEPLVQWQATNDAILSYYALERAIDGDTTQFSVIATISPNGIDTTTQTYSFSDPGANPGVNYYRLKMQDTTVIYSYSNTIAVQPAGKAAMLNLYPNPVKIGWTDAVLPDATNASRFQLIDMSGRPLKNIYIPAGIPLARIDLTGVIPGVYKLTWSDGKHTAYNLVLVLPEY
jgi:hypothetical protein